MKCHCTRPFAELSLQHDGEILPCCLLGEYSLGNIKQTSVEQAWNSPKMKALRSDLLSESPSICQQNMQNKGCHLWFKQNHYSIEANVHQTESPKRLDMRLNGKCNLKCIMCDVWQTPDGPYTEENFWRDAELKILPNVKELFLLGGEPFVQKDTFRLFELVAKTNDDCSWHITTNGHYQLTNSLVNKIRPLQLRTITMSIDGIFPDTYRKIRRGGRLKVVLKCLKDWIKFRDDYRPELRIKCDFVVQKDNFYDCEPFIQYIQKLGLEYSFIFLEGPKEYSLLDLGRQERLKIFQLASHYFTQSNDSQWLKILHPLEQSLNLESSALPLFDQREQYWH